MDARVTHEWTSSEVEEARSLIMARLSNDSNHDGDMNKKHNAIVQELHAWFPWSTMQQVTNLYVDLVVEMHMTQLRCRQEEDQESTVGAGAGGTHGGDGVYPMINAHVNDNFGVPEEAASMDGKGLEISCPLLNEMGIMVEAPVMGRVNKVEVLGTNKVAVDRPVVAPLHAGRFWTTEEHRLFLRGLCVYGRGDWKNISRHFVTTRTPVQVSSHAQKYFRRLQSSSTRQRYSINDVGLHDADPWMAAAAAAAENRGGGGGGAWQALAFAGAHHYPSLGLQTAASPFVTMDSLAQLWSPLLYRPQASQQPAPWSEQQVMASAAAVAPMEGAGSSAPAGQQGVYNDLAAEQWMMNNNMY